MKPYLGFKNWQITSWEVEWLDDCIAIVGYVYDHPNFKDGQKVFIKLKTKQVFKYTYH
jgi:hypothetical protein